MKLNTRQKKAIARNAMIAPAGFFYSVLAQAAKTLSNKKLVRK